VVRQHRAVLSVGSNLGDRLGTLQGCVHAIGRLPDTDVLARSPVYETAPVGGPVQPDYLNAVLIIGTGLAPRALLTATQRIEAAFGRVRPPLAGPLPGGPIPPDPPRPLPGGPIPPDPPREETTPPFPPEFQRYGPRTLDIDIISYDEEISDDPVLTLPHPRARERAFVLAPWHDIDPAAVLPGHGPVAALLARTGPAGVGVRRRPDLVLDAP
jgi:2-amino-4-hydroxy-6-hydroxymethyldihydropteridine diphosphokinase